jgi:hypothetical protein
MRKLLITMSITYLLIDCLFNFLLPVMVAIIVIFRIDVNKNFSSDGQAWRETM